MLEKQGLLKDAGKQREEPSMNEQETITFLKESGARPFAEDEWEPNQPLLYVLEEEYRRKGSYENPVAQSTVPSVARLDRPMRFRWVENQADNTQPDSLAHLETDGGQIDYFAIDPRTKKVQCIGIGRPIRTADSGLLPFLITRSNLFMPVDTLFPKSPDKPSSGD